MYLSLAGAVLRSSSTRYAFSLVCKSQIVYFLSGAAEDMAHSSLRFGIGRFTTAAEVDFVVKHIISTVHRLREMRSVFFVRFRTRY